MVIRNSASRPRQINVDQGRPKQVSILQVSKYPSVQVSQVSKYPSIQVSQVCKCTSIQVTQVCKYPKYASMQVPAQGSANKQKKTKKKQTNTAKKNQEGKKNRYRCTNVKENLPTYRQRRVAGTPSTPPLTIDQQRRRERKPATIPPKKRRGAGIQTRLLTKQNTTPTRKRTCHRTANGEGRELKHALL